MSIGGGGGKVKETEAQKEATEIANKNYDRYRLKYRPARNRYIGRVQDNYASDKARALGTASGDSAAAFGGLANRTTEALSQRGVGLGSGRSNFAATTTLGDQAQSRGLNLTSARQAVEDTHRNQQQGIINSAQGQATDAIQGYGTLANLANRQAQYDAQVAQDKAAGVGGLIGTGIGIIGGGINQYFNRPRNQSQGLSGFGKPGSQYPGSDQFDE